MPPKTAPRVAEPSGTPLPLQLDSGLSSGESTLILFSVATMILIALVFMAGLAYFNRRMKNEQKTMAGFEKEAFGRVGGTGDKPDAPPPGRDFVPMAEFDDQQRPLT
jgi:hypothetical protein